MFRERLLKWLGNTIETLELANPFIKFVNGMGMVFFMMMVFLMFVDVFLRYFFNNPIGGDIEIIEFMLVIVVFFGVAYTGLLKRHVAINFLVKRLPPKPRVFVGILVSFLSLTVFLLIFWQSIHQYERYDRLGTKTNVLGLPISPLLLVIAFGAVLLSLVLLRELLEEVTKGLKLNFRFSWLIMALLIVIFLGIGWIAQTTWRIDAFTAGIVGSILLFVLLFMGIPVGFGLAFVGFLGMAYLRNMGIGLSLLGVIPFRTTASFDFCVIPLFVLMGVFCFYAYLSRDLYYSAYCWLGHFPGGLSMATVAGCAGFAALCGDSLTTAVTMGTVALPEMERYKYDPALATGCVAAGGTIGILIPPSIGFILYALLTDQSIGALFIAGILPGLLLTTLFILSTYIRCRINSELGPPGPKTSFWGKVISLKRTWAMIVLFGIVIGGIYGGLFTPTEAGGIGAFGAFSIGVISRRLSFQNIIASLIEAGAISAMAFVILSGANIFSYFLAASKLPLALADFVSSLILPPLMILMIILLVYLILGCLMPAVAMIILTLPILFPTILALGYDPIWFGVIMVIMLELAVITPPIGINVFGLSGIAKGVPMETIFKGIIPYFLMLLCCIAILIIFPSIATFLPKVMGFMK